MYQETIDLQQRFRDAIASRPGVLALTAGYLAVLAALSYSASVVDRFPGEVTVTTWVQSWRTGWLDSAVKEGFQSGAPVWGGLMVAVTVAALFLTSKGREAIVLMAAIGLTVAIDFGLNEVVARPRPSSELVRVFADFDGHSFPSSHVTYYTVFLGTLAVITTWNGATRLSRSAIYGALALALTLVGFSRVYLGAHWLGDVIGGYVLGAGVVAIVVLGWRLWTDGGSVPEVEAVEPPAEPPSPR
jgi:undecaprenyl-diphosphatase